MVRKTDIRYTEDLLNELLDKYDATLVGKYDKFSSRTKIKFICACGQEGCKSFVLFPKFGIHCRLCVNEIMAEKTKKTNIKKFGCEDPNQLPEMKKKIKEIFQEKYGVDSPMKTKEVQDKMKNIFIEKYGVENPFQNEDVKKKLTSSLLRKYGVEHPLQNKEIHNKFEKTLMTNYGVTVPYHSEELKQRGVDTCLENYGCEYSLQNSEIRKKSVATNLQRYGVENANQNKEIQTKIQINSKKYKKYTMPSGIIRNVQGYEPFAIKKLLTDGYKEEQIITNRSDIPRILYKVNEKDKYYFPDIFIPHENKIIEVKSTWTYSSKTDNIELKANACRAESYNYEIWVYNYKGERVIVA